MTAIKESSLIEQYLESREKGERELLSFLSFQLREMESAKWEEVGMNHRLWKRDWAIYRNIHVRDTDFRLPWPLENNLWSLIEGGRPIWGDNPPTIDWTTFNPELRPFLPAIQSLWEEIYLKLDFAAWWESIYDYLPQLGTTITKIWLDTRSMGGPRVRIATIDPRTVFADPLARLNHRSARMFAIRWRVEVGEVKARMGEKGKPLESAMTEEIIGIAGQEAVALARGLGAEAAGAIHPQRFRRTVEVVEFWLNPDLTPDRQSIFTEEQETLDMPDIERPNKWIVLTYVPDFGIISEQEINTGPHIVTSQNWRNPDSIWGISDVRMVVGLQVALDQLAMRGHIHRLAMFAPPLIVPKTANIDAKHLGGRPAPVIYPRDEESARGIRYVEVTGPNQEAMNYFLMAQQRMRRILGFDEITTEFFQREQTAAATAILASAIESRLRQKMRNTKPMVEDIAKTALRLMFTYKKNAGEASVILPTGEVSIADLFKLEMEDLEDFIPVTSLERVGPLSKAARINAINAAVSTGAAVEGSPLPLVVRKTLLKEFGVPNADQIIEHFEKKEAEKEAAEAAQAQAVQALQSLASSVPSPQSSTRPPQINPALAAEEQMLSSVQPSIPPPTP